MVRMQQYKPDKLKIKHKIISIQIYIEQIWNKSIILKATKICTNIQCFRIICIEINSYIFKIIFIQIYTSLAKNLCTYTINTCLYENWISFLNKQNNLYKYTYIRISGWINHKLILYVQISTVRIQQYKPNKLRQK